MQKQQPLLELKTFDLTHCSNFHYSGAIENSGKILTKNRQKNSKRYKLAAKVTVPGKVLALLSFQPNDALPHVFHDRVAADRANRSQSNMLHPLKQLSGVQRPMWPERSEKSNRYSSHLLSAIACTGRDMNLAA